ncbi:MAG: LytTR family DNA-binding domain-containing protein [Bacteroidetes bacterium]|nr:LytTR family DNA-binding domain-containing protein [Bacteroidota bacterium]
MDRIRVIIVDDEPLGRSRIRTLLEKEVDVEIIAECPNGRLAVKHIRTDRPDLVFLDIQMPGMDGFEALAQLESHEIPLIIFATAYDEYAIRAFDVNALDYLLKPFDRDRFYDALTRARQKIRSNRLVEYQERVHDGVAEALTSKEADRSGIVRRFFVRTIGRVEIVGIEEIDWIGAAGNYAELHAGENRHLIRETMSALENRLPRERFIRVHRSAIVNLDRIGRFDAVPGGRLQLTLRDGTNLMVSRGYGKALRQLMRGKR